MSRRSNFKGKEDFTENFHSCPVLIILLLLIFLLLHVNAILGVIEHEREQRIQMQQSMESLLKSQKLQIIKLREELDNEKLVSGSYCIS